MRGLKGAEIEFGLEVLAHNMRKLTIMGYDKLVFVSFENMRDVFLSLYDKNDHNIAA